ncbi:MAG TPA: site-specific DNA-methyltransferase [Verrucomicrobiota bacterium]|nr:MAG: Modification methylase DpnIIB [Verrucomicrobia bacterium ADurb.Bin118]HPY30194.1 site-specific DNA-methyltransferase [Verrucomicrobiota bacterium]HQB16428.1 site-specific DNA-methyltransferase [Verrucomicrobiota bacterium]
MTPEQREELIRLLQQGEDLSPEWARILFPPEKREYELVYHGKEREEDILANTLAVPLQPVRTFGKNGDGWHNMLIFGDNLQAMKSLLELKKAGKLCNADGTPGVRLVYIDPPFGTGDEYAITDDLRAYSAKMQGSRFIEFLRKRLVLLRELLSDDGSIYIRIDYHFGHFIKVITDEVFGPQFFQNEIVINRFKRQLRGLKGFNVATDCLFLYSKGSDFVFAEQMRTRLCSFCGQEKEPDWHHMVSPGLRNPPERTILGRRLLPPRGQHWKYKQTRIEEMEKEGRIRINQTVGYTDLNGKRIQGLPEFLQTQDTPVDSNWTDLRGYVLSSRYPTENPEELLERAVRASSLEGDLVLDAFAGSGTTCAVAEKLGRRWIGIDCGKLAIYTIQKRMLNLRREIGNKGPVLQPKPFTLYNAGLYDFSQLKALPWESWRFFALQLFQCRDEPHKIGGIPLDGYLKGSSVLVFNHQKQPGIRIDEATIRSLHEALGSRVGRRLFMIAPALTFDFQQDYLDLDDVRYYALRIPYSIIHELHQREFTALKQPADEMAVNDTVEAVGFDFIRTPELDYDCGVARRKGELLAEAFLRIKTFKSEAVVREPPRRKGNRETLSMLMLDFDYDGEVFVQDAVFFADGIEKAGWEVRFPVESVGRQVMAVFIDIYGNEAREVIPGAKLGHVAAAASKTKKKGGRK